MNKVLVLLDALSFLLLLQRLLDYLIQPTVTATTLQHPAAATGGGGEGGIVGGFAPLPFDSTTNRIRQRREERLNLRKVGRTHQSSQLLDTTGDPPELTPEILQGLEWDQIKTPEHLKKYGLVKLSAVLSGGLFGRFLGLSAAGKKAFALRILFPTYVFGPSIVNPTTVTTSTSTTSATSSTTTSYTSTTSSTSSTTTSSTSSTTTSTTSTATTTTTTTSLKPCTHLVYRFLSQSSQEILSSFIDTRANIFASTFCTETDQRCTFGYRASSLFQLDFVYHTAMTRWVAVPRGTLNMYAACPGLNTPNVYDMGSTTWVSLSANNVADVGVVPDSILFTDSADSTERSAVKIPTNVLHPMFQIPCPDVRCTYGFQYTSIQFFWDVTIEHWVTGDLSTGVRSSQSPVVDTLSIYNTGTTHWTAVGGSGWFVTSVAIGQCI